MKRQSINTGQRISPSARRIIKLRQRAFQSGGASLELQVPTNYIRSISRNLNNDITRDVVRRNLLNWSEDFSNSVWVKSNITITQNSMLNPFGFNNGYYVVENTSNTSHFVVQSASKSSGVTYTVSYYIQKADDDWVQLAFNTTAFGDSWLNFNFTTGNFGNIGANLVSSTKTSLGNGWWKITLTATSSVTDSSFGVAHIFGTNNTNSVLGLTYVGSSRKICNIACVQYEQSSISTAYQPTQTLNTDTGASLIMSANTIGESRIFNCKPDIYNLLQRTEEFDNAYWSKTRTAIVVNSIANPIDGQVTVDKLREDTTASASHYLQRIVSLETNKTYTLSTWVKAGERNFIILSLSGGVPAWGTGSNPMVNFDCITGTAGFVQNATYTIQNYGNGWFRVSMTPTLTLLDGTVTTSAQIALAISGTTPIANYNGDGASGLYVWGAQLEKGSVPTAYQRITDGITDFQITRATTATVVQKDGTIGNGCYNLSPYSEDYTNAAWTKTLTTVTANTDANPLTGAVNVCKVLANTTSNVSTRIFNTLAPNTTGVLTLTGYVKAFLNVPFIHIAVLTSAGTAATTLGACIDTSNGNITQGRLNGSPTTILPNTSSSTVVNGYIYFRMTWDNPTNLVFVNLSIYLATDAVSTSFIGNVGDGVYLSNLQLVQGSTPKGYLKTTNRLNVPSIDYSLGSTKPALLVEPLRTNLILRSEEFDNAYWLKSNITITPNTVLAPNGTLTADSLFETITNANHYLGLTTGNTTTIGTTLTYSTHLKYNGRQWVLVNMFNAGDFYAYFDLVNGVVGNIVGAGVTASIKHVVDGWYRVSITRTLTSTSYDISVNPVLSNGSSSVFIGDNTKGYYIWGTQVEAGSNPTSYITTTTATVTRNAHTSFVDLFNNNLLNKDNFTLYVEGQLLGSATTNISIGLSDTTATGARANDLGIIDGITPSYAVGGVITSDVTSSNVNEPFKLTIKRDGTSVKWFRNGALVYTQTIAVFDYRYLILNGVSTFLVQKIALWKHSKTDAECIALHNA